MIGVEEIIAQASELPDDERAAIAARLIEGLPAPDYDVSDDEVRERGHELENGEVQDISLDQLKAGLDL